MGNDDINILFAGCIAVIMLIISLFEKKEQSLAKSEIEVQEIVEEKPDRLIE